MGAIGSAGRATVVLVVCLVAGCLETRLVPCGERACPVGTTCVAGELCATPEQLDACDGAADASNCLVRGSSGRCDRGVCVAARCGNGEVEIGEACDDGNAQDGDGCAGDCRKLEICGDGVIDPGEGCDDGNANPVDSCDGCRAMTWTANVIIGGAIRGTQVGLSRPEGVAVDRHGNVYIADTYNHLVRRIDTTGVATTIAGTGNAGPSSENVQATTASLSYPCTVAVDGLGNVYIGDEVNRRVRRVDPTGIITTIAGTGISGSSGDGGPATSAQVGAPCGLAIDGLGTLYFADRLNHRVRKVDLGGVITTVAGTGAPGFGGDSGAATAAQLNSPRGVALGPAGEIYIADTANYRVRRVSTSGTISTTAGVGTLGDTGDGGPATSATVVPLSIATDELGNVYVSTQGTKVRRIDTSGVITKVAGGNGRGFAGDGGPAIDARLEQPYGVSAALGKVYIADTMNMRIRQVDEDGTITTIVGSGFAGSLGDGGIATSAALSTSGNLARDAQGALYIPDTNHQRVRRIDASGIISTVAGTGTFGSSGDGGPAVSALFRNPAGIAIHPLGELYIADTDTSIVRRVAANDIITTVVGIGTSGYTGDDAAATAAQLDNPQGLAFDGLGNLYIADTENDAIRRVNTGGTITTIAGTGTRGYNGDNIAATSAQLAGPRQVVLDAQGNLYIADQLNHRIRRVDTSGKITTVAGTGTPGLSGDGMAATSAMLNQPAGVGFDSAGRLHIADTYNHRVRRISGGTITTIVGAVNGSGGAGGSATSFQPSYPLAVEFDSSGNLYVLDSARIHRVDAAGIVKPFAGAIDPEGMGPLSQAHLVDPRAFVLAGPFTLFAGGTSGTVQAQRSSTLEVVAGRYPQIAPTGTLARFRDYFFGSVMGVAYDAAASLLYLTETSTHRIRVVTVVDPADQDTWTIATVANSSGIAGYSDGNALTARFRSPAGLYLDAAAHRLYVADAGNHAIRVIDLSSGMASATASIVAGTPATLGFFGDGGQATAALLNDPQAVTRCPNGDLFIADTGNHRVRRVAASTGAMSTVLGDGFAVSSGDGSPATNFPVNAPQGLACDAMGNLYVTSTTVVRLLPANSDGIVDGSGEVETIYGSVPRDTFPANVTRCLTGVVVVAGDTVQVTDACTGMLIELRRVPE